MASSESRRRKQLEKKKKKRTEKRHQLLVRRNAGLADQLLLRAKAPVHECLISAALEDQGLGEVIICRRSASGEIALGLFLVDRYCMGVKDCFGRIISGAEYRGMKEKMDENGRDLRRIDAASARRLVEDAVTYAESLGLKPHSDYRAARLIFGDIDPSAATERFELGKDGKPYFMPGPFQSPAECQLIMNKLTAVCGPQGFHFTMAMGPRGTMPPGTHFDELSFDDEDDLENIVFAEDDDVSSESIANDEFVP